MSLLNGVWHWLYRAYCSGRVYVYERLSVENEVLDFDVSSSLVGSCSTQSLSLTLVCPIGLAEYFSALLGRCLA